MYHALLIVGQFLIAAVIVLSTGWRPIPWGALLLSVPGAAFAMSAWFAIGLRELRIHPTTTNRTRLVRSGPYRFVRHPMYSGLLLFTAAFVLANLAWWRCLLWFALLGILFAKSREEEHSLSELFDDYATYQRQIGRLLPRLLQSK